MLKKVLIAVSTVNPEVALRQAFSYADMGLSRRCHGWHHKFYSNVRNWVVS
jgi:hypothetical protein